jgi:hypothetical protein
MHKRWLIPALALTGLASAFGQTGSLRGTVIDRESRRPLPGVNVLVLGTSLGAAADTAGDYLIPDVPVGTYRLEFRCVGYGKRTVPDVFVKSNRTVFVNADLAEQAVQGREVRVSAGYFRAAADEPVSVQSLSYEEIRRAPGAREDVSRMLQNLPGVNPTSDDRNDLVIRGGSPTEVLFMIDRIEVPNPNHFGTQGATGGPVSMINTEFVENMTFMSGGFTSEYGGRVSGAMDIRLREGNRYGYNGKADLNFGGAGGYAEGPLGKGRGSFLVGVHRSFLDFLSKVLNYGGTPIYSNTQGKLVYDLDGRNRLSLEWLGGDDRIKIGYKVRTGDFTAGAADTADYQKVDFRSRQFTAGMNWRSFWAGNFYTQFSLSHSYNRFYTDVRSVAIAAWNEGGHLTGRTKVSESALYDNVSTENVSTARLDANWQTGRNTSLSFGGQVKLNTFDHDIRYLPAHPDRPDAYGRKPLGLEVRRRQDLAPKEGAYFNLKQRPFDRLTVNLGARADRFDLLDETCFSPRLNVSYDAGGRVELHAGTGRYYQDPEFIFITSDASNKRNLKDIRCDHFIAGVNVLLAPSARLTVEVYRKLYGRYPVSADSGYEMITMANTGAEYGSNGTSGRLVSLGRGRANGIDLMIQKKMSDRVYGLVSYSRSVIRNRALDGVYRDGAFDNRNVFNLVFGWQRNKNWEYSAKWRYAGGTPYTPYDRQASIAANEGRLDLTAVNGERFPAYHRLDLRVDHREYYRKGSLVEYFSIENAYDRKNVLNGFWNRAGQKMDYNYQTGFFVVGGVSYEF